MYNLKLQKLQKLWKLWKFHVKLYYFIRLATIGLNINIRLEDIISERNGWL